MVGPWEMVMLVLCVYVLGALFADTMFHLPPPVSELLNYIDTLVCLVFFGDFLYHLIRAKSRLAYLKWGWIDLLSSIPNVPWLRLGRFARVIRIIRVLRAIKSTGFILRHIYANRARGTLASVALISFVLVVFSSIAILNFEIAPDSNIKTPSDALWWSFTTIATVGYGDLYPKTSFGRIIGVVMMSVGVGLFGTLTAYIASIFLNQEEIADKRRDELTLAEIRAVRERLDNLEKALSNGGSAAAAKQEEG